MQVFTTLQQQDSYIYISLLCICLYTSLLCICLYIPLLCICLYTSLLCICLYIHPCYAYVYIYTPVMHVSIYTPAMHVSISTPVRLIYQINAELTIRLDYNWPHNLIADILRPIKYKIWIAEPFVLLQS